MLTADTITDEQIHALWEDCIATGRHVMLEMVSLALRTPTGMSRSRRQARSAARARCAEILNARDRSAL